MHGNAPTIGKPIGSAGSPAGKHPKHPVREPRHAAGVISLMPGDINWPYSAAIEYVLLARRGRIPPTHDSGQDTGKLLRIVAIITACAFILMATLEVGMAHPAPAGHAASGQLTGSENDAGHHAANADHARHNHGGDDHQRHDRHHAAGDDLATGEAGETSPHPCGTAVCHAMTLLGHAPSLPDRAEFRLRLAWLNDIVQERDSEGLRKPPRALSARG